MSKKYIIKNGTAVEVSDEVYKILRKWDRHIKYFLNGFLKIKKLSDEVSFLVTQLFECLFKHYLVGNRFSEVGSFVFKIEPRQTTEKSIGSFR